MIRTGNPQQLPRSHDQSFARAIAAFRNGQLTEAEQLCRSLVAAAEHADVVHLLGLVLCRQGKTDDGIKHIRRAVELSPRDAEAHGNLANALLDAARPADAAASFRRAIDLKPDFAEAYHGLGVALLRQHAVADAVMDLRRALALKPDLIQARIELGSALAGRGEGEASLACFAAAMALRPGHAEIHVKLAGTLRQLNRDELAIDSYRRAVQLSPATAALYYELGNVLARRKLTTEAIASYRRALELNLDRAELHNNLAVVLREQGDVKEAIVHYHRAIALDANFAEARYNLGNALKDLGRFDEAVAQYRETLASRPAYAAAHYNLGNALTSLRRHVDAEGAYVRSIALSPDQPDAHLNLGSAHEEVGRLEDAIACYRRALGLRPHDVRSFNNLGLALAKSGRVDEAVVCYLSAIALDPAQAEVYFNLGTARSQLGQVAQAVDSYRSAVALKPPYAKAHSNTIFWLDFLPDVGFAEHYRERRDWYRRNCGGIAPLPQRAPRADEAARRLRLGYVSRDFRRHSAASLFGPVIHRHDRSSFEVVLYSGVPASEEDEVTQAFRRSADLWRATDGLSDAALASLIHDDRIDILIDLAGHSKGNRLIAFAYRPAPIQVTGWGHATGTGMPTMDYLFSDPVAVPTEARRHFAEQIVDLPSTLCYQPPDYAPEAAPAPSSNGTPVTFGCFNRLSKLTDSVADLWARLLLERPDTRLLLRDASLGKPANQARTRAAFARRGVAEHRLILRTSQHHAEHLAGYAEVDIALDPFPATGGMTTLEALWMGVPVVTLLGNSASARSTASIVSALGSRDWIADSADDYLAIALRLAGDVETLARIHRELRPRFRSAPVGDVAGHCRAVEAAYRGMWRRFCEGRTPGPLV
ncbi:MAG: tetratricopeptide repeat protein [Alphaproteobacteria bacterium]|nr:tetratricopeptide repeat protein [Alphaproteobacteria bacterium]